MSEDKRDKMLVGYLGDAMIDLVELCFSNGVTDEQKVRDFIGSSLDYAIEYFKDNTNWKGK